MVIYFVSPFPGVLRGLRILSPWQAKADLSQSLTTMRGRWNDKNDVSCRRQQFEQDAPGARL